MKYLTGLLIAVLIMALITACDDRGGDKPKIFLSADNTHLYSDGGNCNLDYAIVSFVLEGSAGYINDAKILVEYNSDKALFAGTGSSLFVRTNNQGIANGTFQIKEGVSGVVNLTARMDRFREVKTEIGFIVYRLPEIESFTTQNDITTLPPEGDVNIFVQLKCPDGQIDNIRNRNVLFSTNKGLLEKSVVVSNNDGIAQNLFSGGGGTGQAVITAKLELCNNVSQTLTITLE